MALQQQAQNEPAQSDKPEDNVVGSEPSNEPPMDKTEAPMIFSGDLPTDPQLSDQDQQSSQPSRRAFVKEIEDEEAGGFARWVEDYPGNAGKTYSMGQSYFECWRMDTNLGRHSRTWKSGSYHSGLCRVVLHRTQVTSI